MQIDNNSTIKNDTNFKIIYHEMLELKNNIFKFEYSGVKGKEAYELWANELRDDIHNNFFTILMKGREDKYTDNIPIKDFNRIIFLWENLRTNNEHNDFIKEELTSIFNENLKTTCNIIKDWDFDNKQEIMQTMHIASELFKEKEMWKTLESKISQL